jgi:chemotaxis protein MotB
MAADDVEEVAGVPEWVVTYGDMMSLLLTFFIMLVSMSEVRSDDGKVRAMMDAFHERFGPTMGKKGAPGESAQDSSNQSKVSSKGVGSHGGSRRVVVRKKGGVAHTRPSNGSVMARSSRWGDQPCLVNSMPH